MRLKWMRERRFVRGYFSSSEKAGSRLSSFVDERGIVSMGWSITL